MKKIALTLGAAAVIGGLGYWAVKGFSGQKRVELPTCGREIDLRYTNRLFEDNLEGTVYNDEERVGTVYFTRSDGKWSVDLGRSDLIELTKDISSVARFGKYKCLSEVVDAAKDL
ncbi:hypothetical protein HY496_02875 [Candidatus Woesearchaeota archaeon]|nr:hypothetical protein [Candidatus Woesearchaeota archaeon]